MSNMKFEDVKLKSGRIVTHRFVSENTQEAILDGMTNAEWEDYAEQVKKRTQLRYASQKGRGKR